jgi:hypothetical protein
VPSSPMRRACATVHGTSDNLVDPTSGSSIPEAGEQDSRAALSEDLSVRAGCLVCSGCTVAATRCRVPLLRSAYAAVLLSAVLLTGTQQSATVMLLLSLRGHLEAHQQCMSIASMPQHLRVKSNVYAMLCFFNFTTRHTMCCPLGGFTCSAHCESQHRAGACHPTVCS